MSEYYARHRSDSNQIEIIEFCRSIGASVQVISMIDNFCDLCVGYMGTNYLLEVKGKKTKVTPEQKILHSTWSGKIHVIRSIEDVIAVMPIRDTKLINSTKVK